MDADDALRVDLVVRDALPDLFERGAALEPREGGAEATRELLLTGETFDGRPVEGRDAVIVVAADAIRPCGRGFELALALPALLALRRALWRGRARP